ncbi:TIGR02569 family protein [Jatrophihabitans lederbergiae]|uniref:TIGR02569 family protein n=1 Tax=Jatrophihabitans lederbergiae TaxID=3075547 RepID=A0ABU2J785_9ACTN|nr:TIGR02569 family protein [Jatrophihabitans sp. DSM 44399]MDT0260851.1 TIGR02569 family protein [Jatrophihabitans sp. DSM 44399]
MIHSPPPQAVREAFGVTGEPLPLSGGQQTVWRVGEAVLKPMDCNLEALRWQAEVLRSLDGHPDFRVAPPLLTGAGLLVAAGWTAWRYEPGGHVPRRWPDIIAIGRAFHLATATLPEPAFLRGRQDRWARADRVAWGDSPAAPFDRIPELAALFAALRPLAALPQVIHGDLTGNVLFAEDQPPLVLDVSPYWRPAPAAAAVVVADALVFESADAGVLGAVTDIDRFEQYLLRALLFRGVTDVLARRGSALSERYAGAIELVLRLADG